LSVKEFKTMKHYQIKIPIIVVLLIAGGLFGGETVLQAQTTPAADFTYTTNQVGYTVGIVIAGFSSTGYADVVQAGGHLNFPDTINGYPVLGIESFGNRTALVSVRIPDSVTTIYGYAFEYCTNLTTLTIGTNVTAINDVAFAFCDHLSNVTLPDSLVWIGSSTFSYCHALTSITIPNNVRNIGDQTFFGCTSVTNVTIGKSVMSINTEAFAYCYGLKSVTIPASMTSFGVGMFYGCSNLTSAYFLCNPPPCNNSPGSLNTDTFQGEIGSAGGFPLPPPTPPDMRVRVRRFLAVHLDKQHSFSAMMIAAQCSANRLHRHRDKTTDGRVLPAKFSPSRVVRPSGVTRLVALGTTASADSCKRSGAIADPRSRRCRRGALAGLPE
jgi:hypothetical protein